MSATAPLRGSALFSPFSRRDRHALSPIAANRTGGGGDRDCGRDPSHEHEVRAGDGSGRLRRSASGCPLAADGWAWSTAQVARARTERGAVIVGHDRFPAQVQGGDDRGRLVRPLLRRSPRRPTAPLWTAPRVLPPVDTHPGPDRSAAHRARHGRGDAHHAERAWRPLHVGRYLLRVGYSGTQPARARSAPRRTTTAGPGWLSRTDHPAEPRHRSGQHAYPRGACPSAVQAPGSSCRSQSHGGCRGARTGEDFAGRNADVRAQRWVRDLARPPPGRREVAAPDDLRR
jgi:hypothetical protein